MKILIVDDEPMIVEVLRAYLEREGFQVCSAMTGFEALQKIKVEQPNFIILDLMLPDITGEEICRETRLQSDVPILMLTAKSDVENRIQGLLTGADDYVTKPFSPREVVVRVQSILRRAQGPQTKNHFSFEKGQLIIDVARAEVVCRGEVVLLTPIEFKLLVNMAKHPGRVYSRLDLLERVQEDPYEGYERSIDVHIKNLRKKIEADSKNPVFIVTVFGTGYKFGGKPDAPNSLF